MTKRLLLSLTLSLAACGGGDAPADEPNDETATSGDEAAGSPALALPNQQEPEDGIVTGGAPTEADLEAAAADGFTLVVSLRTDSEPGQAEEAAIVERLGMRFEHIPVAGADGLTLENAQRFMTVLDSRDGPMIVHCGSGNRAGAMMAMRAWLQGETLDGSIAAGQSAGLTGLEDAVRARLAELCESDPERSC